MTAIRRVFVYEFRRHGRRSGYLFMTIGVPLLAIALFFGILVVQRVTATLPNQPPRNNPDAIQSMMPIGIVDQTGHKVIVASALTSHYKPMPDVDSAISALQNGELSGYIVLPPDYRESGNVELWLPRFSVLFSLASETDIGTMLRKSMAASTTGIDSNALARLTEKTPDISNHRLDSTNQVNKTADFSASYVLVYLFALALVFSTFLTSGYLMQAVMEERQNRVIEVLMASLLLMTAPARLMMRMMSQQVLPAMVRMKVFSTMILNSRKI